MTAQRFALVAGGGTAGHLQPALAVAEALVAAGHDRAEIEFVGSTRGQDAAALEGTGFPVTLLPGRGIVRSVAPRHLVGNAVACAELLVAAVRAVGLVGRRRPRVVVAVGGYASLAAGVAAVVRRVPLVLINIDAVPGAANRLLGRFARAAAVAWEGTPLPRAVVTGTPVRPAIAAVEHSVAARREARGRLGLPEDRRVVAAFGGSLGARRINQAVDGLATVWRHRRDLALFHIVGRRDWAAYGDAGPRPPEDGASGLAVVRVPYEDRMDAVYAACDVVVCRAGAMTVAELAAAGVPAVLVPLPGAPGDHQTANARVLGGQGAAVLLADEACTAAGLAGVLDGLLADPASLAAMGARAAGLGRRDAAAAGARVVEAHAAPARGRA